MRRLPALTNGATSPPIVGNAEVGARCPPDRGLDTVLDLAFGRRYLAVEAGQHVIEQQHRLLSALKWYTRSWNSVSRTPTYPARYSTTQARRGRPAPITVPGDAGGRRAARPSRNLGDDNTSLTAATSASAVNGRISHRATLPDYPIGDLPLILATQPPPWAPRCSVLPPSYDHRRRSACRSARVSSSAWLPSPATAQGGTLPGRLRSNATPPGAIPTAPSHPASETARTSVNPAVLGQRGGRRHDHHRPGAPAGMMHPDRSARNAKGPLKRRTKTETSTPAVPSCHVCITC